MKQIIREIAKNGREIVRVELNEYEGHQLFGVRVWYRGQDGALKPTRKGISLGIRHLPALVRALEDAERAARTAGLLRQSADVARG